MVTIPVIFGIRTMIDKSSKKKEKEMEKKYEINKEGRVVALRDFSLV